MVKYKYAKKISNFKEELMGKLKKLVATACFITMTIGAVAPAEAALREKDIIWIGAGYNAAERINGISVDVNTIYGKNVVYKSAANDKYQIYFGATGEKTGFKFKKVTGLAGGDFFYVKTTKNSHNGMIIDEEGNEIYSGLRNIADDIVADDGGWRSSIGIENDRFICGETKEGLVILDAKRNFRVIRRYKGYKIDSKDEIYKTKVNNRRHIRIRDKAKGRLGYLWLSQKSGVSGIIIKNLAKNAELLMNREGEYKIIYESDNYTSMKIKNINGKVVWYGKNKLVSKTAGNLIGARESYLGSSIYPYKGASKEEAGTHILFSVRNIKTDKYGIVRDDGKTMLGFRYSGISKAYKDMAIVEDKYEKEYLVNYKNNKLTSKKYDKIYTFNNGKAVVKLDNKYGIISSTGKELVKPTYSKLIATKLDEADTFGGYVVYETKIKNISDGMIVKKGEEYTYINKEGKQKVIEEAYDNIKKLSNKKYNVSPLLVTMLDDKFGIMAADGKELHKPKYEFFRVLSKSEGIFSLGIKKYGKTGGYVSETIIDKYGKKLFTLSHTKSIKRVYTGEYIVVKDKYASKDKKTEKVMLYDAQWKKIAEFNNKWAEIENYSNGLFIAVNKDNEYGIVDKTGKAVLPFKYKDISFDGDCITVKEAYDGLILKGILVR